MRPSSQDTIAAIATPPGESGIGVIRLSGPSALSIVSAIFKPAKPIKLPSVPSHTCYLGTIFSQDKTPTPQPSPSSGEGGRRPGEGEKWRTIDQVIVAVFRAPHSYTGEDVVEISAHGSPFVRQKSFKACYRQGARAAEPGEFTQRAFLAGK